MMNLQAQKGMTAIGWLFVLTILGFFAIIGIKLVPVYINGFNMYSSMESLSKNRTLLQKPMQEVRKTIRDNLDINYASDVKPEDITIARKGQTLEISISYAVYRPVVGNLSLVVEFDKTVVVQ